MVNNVFLGIGSNKGNRYEYIARAVGLIGKDEKCSIIKCSSVYETSPYGDVEQENFLNAVIEIETSYNAAELFESIKSIETLLGRKSTIKWGSREIDIDILFYNGLIYNSDELIIPHPEALKRDFVIVPMVEVAPNFVHPLQKIKMKDFDLTAVESHILSKANYQLN